MLVQAGAQVNKPFRLAHENRGNVGGQRVDRENVRKTVLGLQSFRLSISNGCIVDYSIHRAEFVYLFSQ
jgi:hypothetical protein